LAVREGVRYAFEADLDLVLREDVNEIKLYFAPNDAYDERQLREELDRKAQGHELHQWFVQFYDAAGRRTWSSLHTPDLPVITAKQRQLKSFSLGEYRLVVEPLSGQVPSASSVCVGCSQKFITRDMSSIDRLVLGVGVIVLLISPLVGYFLTNRTIQPLAQMIRTTARLRPGELGQRMPIRGTGDELDSLARTINGLLDRISSYLKQEQDFLANSAHDLRTPLAAIRSSVEVALSGERTEAEYHELLGLVIEQCSALQMLVNQLLLLAETGADRLQTDEEAISLEQVVSGAVEMFEAVAEFHGIQLKTVGLASVFVAGNRHHLRQVVNNLLDNAIKFTAAANPLQSEANPPAGDVESRSGQEPTPTIEVELTSDPVRGQGQLRVTDNGVGISADHLPHVFERFFRADKVRGREGMTQGSGLGLSICKAIVEAHRGEIHVKSKPGRGTTFTVTLPLAPRPTEEALATARAGARHKFEPAE
jgi:signal transduction histidine kinase